MTGETVQEEMMEETAPETVTEAGEMIQTVEMAEVRSRKAHRPGEEIPCSPMVA